MDNCPGDDKSLSLPTGQPAATFGNNSVHTHGHVLNIISKPHCTSRSPGIINGQIPRGSDDIGKDISTHELCILQHHPNLTTDHTDIYAGQFLAVIKDGSRFLDFKAKKQPEKCRLS